MMPGANDDPEQRKNNARKQLQRELKKARAARLVTTRDVNGTELIWFCDQADEPEERRKPREAGSFG